MGSRGQEVIDNGEDGNGLVAKAVVSEGFDRNGLARLSRRVGADVQANDEGEVTVLTARGLTQARFRMLLEEAGVQPE